MTRLFPSVPGWLRAAAPVVAVVLGGASLLETGLSEPLHPVDFLLALGITAALLVAVLLPLTGLVAAQLLVAAPFLAGGDPYFGGALLIADLVLVAHLAYRRPLRPALVGYVLAAALPATTIVLSGEAPWEFFFFPLILGPGFLVGMLLRREQSRTAELAGLARELATERERHARTAVAEERVRISRELHDAVAHSVSVMTLQAGVVRRSLARRGLEDSAEHTALAAVEDLGRRSVDELRRVVGLLREPDDAPELAPRVSLAGLGELADQVTRAGTPVDVRVTGVERELAPALDMSAYRIVQEALSNTLRHAGPRARACVELGWTAQALEMRISDTGEPVGDAGTGHGLVGMRERAEMFGGRFSAGPGDGGFVVHAVLPLTGAEQVAS